MPKLQLAMSFELCGAKMMAIVLKSITLGKIHRGIC